jgi:hypothetical protein
MKTNRLQACIITLSDGTTATFVGKAIFKKGENRTITNIQFSHAEQLPNGCTWETIENLTTDKP